MNELTWVPIGTLVILGAVSMLLPRLTPRRYYFGLTVEPGFPESEVGRGIRRGYLSAVGIALVLAAALIVAFPSVALPAAMFLVPLTAGAAFFYARSRVQVHSTPIAAVREAEISRGPERLPIWTLLALPPFAMLACVAAYLRAHWDEIPARFPVHWGWDGEPNHWVSRSPHGVYGPLWISAAILAMLIILGVAGYYGSRRSAMRVAMLKMMLCVMYLIAFVFGMVAILPLWHFSTLAFELPVFVLVGVVLVYSYKLTSDPDIPVDATPDSCWRLSSIYYNPADPALFVQKRIGLGYTLNFANPMSWLVTAVILALIPAAIFLLR
jgi:uncharacterized membrane protein